MHLYINLPIGNKKSKKSLELFHVLGHLQLVLKAVIIVIPTKVEVVALKWMSNLLIDPNVQQQLSDTEESCREALVKLPTAMKMDAVVISSSGHSDGSRNEVNSSHASKSGGSPSNEV